MHVTNILFPKIRSRRLLVLLFIFLISVLIRIPNLGRPLSKHHEFCTAVALQVMTVWEEEGIATFSFNPAMNFKGESNKFINNLATSAELVKDKKGNYYYVSHPPFGYYLPYIVFSTFNIKPDVRAIQYFNLCVHFLCAIFIYLIVRQLIKSGDKNRDRLSLMSYLLYLFLPVTLWFHSNVYMSDMLVMLFFLSSIYLYLKYLKSLNRRSLWLFGASVFLMIYTSWLGIIFAFTIIATYLVFLKSRPERMRIMIFTFIPATLAVLLFVWQYAQINGIEAYLKQLLQRYHERGSGFEHSFAREKAIEIGRILLNLVTSYGAFLLLIFTAYFYLRVKKVVIGKDTIRRWILWYSLLPVILLNVVLLNYSGHDFVSLYYALFLILLFIVISKPIMETGIKGIRIINYGYILTLIVSVGLYFAINVPGDYSWKGDRYDMFLNLGTKIAESAKEGEVVFIKGIFPEPQLTYYSHRNLKTIDDDKEAYLFLRRRGMKKGLIVTSSDDNQHIEFRHIENIP